MMLLLLSRKSIFINFSKSNKKFCLSLLYNGRNSFLFVNATKMYQFRVKDSDIKKSSLSLGIISGDFSANNMTKTGLTQPVHNVLRTLLYGPFLVKTFWTILESKWDVLSF